MKPIIDVSSHNGKIDWKKVAPHIDSAIIRIGYRGYSGTGRIVQDAYAEKNILGCMKNGIPFSFYFFPTSVTWSEATEEASWIEWFCTTHKISPTCIFLDSERANPKGYARNDILSSKDRSRLLDVTTSMLNAEGYVTGIYCSEDWYKYKINPNDIQCHGYWIARYGSKEPSMPYTAWQYTSKGEVDGIIGCVDFSVRWDEKID